MFFSKLFIAQHGFHEIIVRVREGGVHLGVGGEMADAVAEEEATVGADHGFVVVVGEVDNDLFGDVEVPAGFGWLDVVAEFDEGGGHDGGGGGVAEGC